MKSRIKNPVLKFVGNSGQRLRSRFHYTVFVYGTEIVFTFGLGALILGNIAFKWPLWITATFAVLGTMKSIFGKLKESFKILTKWVRHQLVESEPKTLLELDQGPQWDTPTGRYFKSQAFAKTQQTLFWTDLEVNKFLAENHDFWATRKDHDYELPNILRQISPVALKKSNVKTGRKKLPIRFNGKLLRLSTEPTMQHLLTSNLEIQKVSYFDGECSNETLKFVDAKFNNVSPVRQFAFDRSGRFKALENSAAANIIGISIFAITSDGYVVFVRQTEGNSVSPGSFASSGSGSLELADLEKFRKEIGASQREFNFKDLLRMGLLRELKEESGALDEDIALDSFRMTSYFRWISRAAKPEFTAVVKLKCTFSQLQSRSTTGKESAFSRNISSVPLSYLQASAKTLKLAKNAEELGQAFGFVIQMVTEGLQETHKLWSKTSHLDAAPSISPSCEFAWFAAAMEFDSWFAPASPKLT